MQAPGLQRMPGAASIVGGAQQAREWGRVIQVGAYTRTARLYTGLLAALLLQLLYAPLLDPPPRAHTDEGALWARLALAGLCAALLACTAQNRVLISSERIFFPLGPVPNCLLMSYFPLRAVAGAEAAVAGGTEPGGAASRAATAGRASAGTGPDGRDPFAAGGARKGPPQDTRVFQQRAELHQGAGAAFFLIHRARAFLYGPGGRGLAGRVLGVLRPGGAAVRISVNYSLAQRLLDAQLFAAERRSRDAGRELGAAAEAGGFGREREGAGGGACRGETAVDGV
jgi:hypothetical protein